MDVLQVKRVWHNVSLIVTWAAMLRVIIAQLLMCPAPSIITLAAATLTVTSAAKRKFVYLRLSLWPCLSTFLWTIALLNATIAQAETKNNPIAITKLEDGVTIVGNEELRLTVATWDVFVAIDPPPYPHSLARKVAALEKTLSAIAALNHQGLIINMESQELRRHRLAAALNMAPQPWMQPTRQDHHRQKRGLINFGGTILHTLFGVATTAQVNRFKEALQEVAGHQATLTHAHNSLASILNQTRDYVTKLAMKQYELREKIITLNTVVSNLTTIVDLHNQRLFAMELSTKVDNYLDILQLAVDQYTDQLALYEQQRTDLQIGKLSKHLLPEYDLDDILAQAQRQHKVSVTKQWLYQYVKVYPVLLAEDQLMFQVLIPLISPKPFLLFSVAAHGVPLNDSNLQITLNVNSLYAINSMTGDLIKPQSCTGHAPTICASAIEFDTSKYQCVRGLITNRKDLTAKCTVEVKHITNEDLISPLAVNQYAVLSLGGNIVTHCYGQTEQYYELSRGTYNISCLSNCRVKGQGWAFQCIDKLNLQRHYIMPEVRTTAHFQFNFNYSAKDIALALPTLPLDNPSLPMLTDIAHLTQAHLAKPLTTRLANNMTVSITNVVLIVIIWIALTIAAFKSRYIIKKIKARMAQIPITSPPESVPLNAIQHQDSHPPQAHHNPPNPPNSPNSIWPSLSQFAACSRLTNCNTQQQDTTIE